MSDPIASPKEKRAPEFSSWGRYPVYHANIIPLQWQKDFPPPVPPHNGMLPVGLGRSYGDVCLLKDGNLITTRALDRLLAFDPQTGILRCEAGVSLAEILDFAVPHGWFLPVTPGTKYVTVGGAIANDIHGKNHHLAGTFGNHVSRFELVRSDGTRILCSPTEHSEWYCATIGGMGLNGGLQDADNLARKLADVITEGASDSLLDLYSLQRRTVCIEFVQEQSIANKKRLEARDPETRRRTLPPFATPLLN